MGIEDLETYGIPPLYQEAAKISYDSIKFVSSKSETAFKSFIAGNHKGLILFGLNGSGKTYAGCKILCRAFEKGFLVYRSTFKNLLEEYTESWKIPEKFFQVAYLFLDEIGKEDQKDLGTKVLEHLVRTRIERNNKVTILATNMTHSEFFVKYGPTIESDAMGYYVGVRLEETDRRKV